ncbi:hypothetical protein GCM10008107_07640 [Psychrosphaera saromensis]|uniref:Invasion protein n=1 Tax=Psychrosphaera saromensis TaxID=716813 RepID=A0A2S7UVA2_9GAMM|nr:SirB2 family protein [Psychrosphaera saromensis]PQJ53926.1 hypothetical protein BTO11_09805 [Psychrosphaera saromensis]GHB61329.1 hypothetical protein GCM10008107_07640 [Psychrosphaera saromensis]GLQ15267.1 hypothetical protein GCM10007917_27220 [Psychrosphaera saromensis]
MYMAVKHTHIMLALISIVLFYFRFYQKQLRGKELNKALKVVPHIIDTLLLISAGVLSYLISQYPLVDYWLTAKLGFVVGYIVFAALAMKAEQKSKAIQMLSIASFCIIFTALFAVTKGQF